MTSRLTPEAARTASVDAVRALRNTWSMRPELKIMRARYEEVLFEALDELLRNRDYWDVGGVEFGDRLMVLSQLKEALSTPNPRRVA